MPGVKKISKKSLDIHQDLLYVFLCAQLKGNHSLLTFPTLLTFSIPKNYLYNQKLLFMSLKVILLLVQRFHQASFLALQYILAPLPAPGAWAGHSPVSPSRPQTLRAGAVSRALRHPGC